MISLYLGDSKLFNLTVEDKSQAPVGGVYPPFDLTGYSVRLTVLKGAKDVQVASVAGTVTNPTAGLASVMLDRTTSASIPPGSYSARFEVLKDPDTENTVYVDTLKVT